MFTCVMEVRRLYEIIIWLGIVIFIALIITAVLIYVQSERFDEKYKKNIEIIRAIKTQKLRDFTMEFLKEEGTKPKNEDDKNFPSMKDYREMEKKMHKSNKNFMRLMKKSADLKMWFDYLPRAKEFLASAALWLFLLSLSVLTFCLVLWVELINTGDVQFSGYLSFLWIFMGIRLFKNLLRYNTVVKNINEHMDMLRDGDVEKF